MPDPNDTTDTPTLPPGDISPADLMKALFPVVVQAASQSAAAATTAAEIGRSNEQALTDFKSSLDRNSEAVKANADAIARYAEALEERNELLRKQNELVESGGKLEKENKKQLHETVRAALVSPVFLQFIQLIVLIGATLGLWSQIPTQSQAAATVQEVTEKPPLGPRPLP